MSSVVSIPPLCGCTERLSAAAKRWRFLRRLRRYDQMDFQFASWQMLHLLLGPRKVYKNFVSRKETKNQFARDDPAFIVLLACFLCVSSALTSIILNLGIAGFIKLLLWTVLVDCIGAGMLIASIMWGITNYFFRVDTTQDVEWSYAFDNHLNAAFPFLIVIHVLQPIFYYPVLQSEGFIATFLANSLFLLACSYYVYITFLGYSSLPILKNTKKLLRIFPLLLATYIITIAFGWNISRTVMRFYLDKVM